MNISESPIVPPIAPENKHQRVNLSSKDKSFSEMLFSENTVMSPNAHLLQNNAFSEETMLDSTNVTVVPGSGAGGWLLQSECEDKIASGIKKESIVMNVEQNQKIAQKELHEQRLMATYKLSYIDITNLIERKDAAAKVYRQRYDAETKGEQIMELANTHNQVGLLSPKMPASNLFSLKTFSAHGEEITSLSAVAVSSMRYKQVENIEKSKIVLSKHESGASLFVRDHFSDAKTLVSLVSDIFSKVKSTLNEVIINGKRG